MDFAEVATSIPKGREKIVPALKPIHRFRKNPARTSFRMPTLSRMLSIKTNAPTGAAGAAGACRRNTDR
jgi:hypothetical protein